LFELHTKTKIYQTNKETYELAERKLRVRTFLQIRLLKKQLLSGCRKGNFKIRKGNQA
jgi:hypothetical protein